MLENILAKSDPRETLQTHTENVLNILVKLKERYEQYLKNMPTDFWDRMFLAALFHDFGKVAENFQNMLLKKHNWKEQHIRHEFISGMVLYVYGAGYYRDNPASLFAVFSHHKPLTDDLFQEKDSIRDIHIKPENLKALVDWLNEELQKRELPKIEGRFLEIFPKTFQKQEGINLLYRKFVKIFEDFRSKNHSVNNVRREYVFYKALLNIADWTASAHDTLSQGLEYNAQYLQTKIVAKLREDKKLEIADTFKFRRFQELAIKQGSILAIAPTGSGKTEAALLWASQKYKFDKIIYLLPTRVTSNAIYERLVNYFGRDKCGVVHSSAFLYLKNLDDQYSKPKYLKDKTFFNEITVCTIDQMLTQGFNLGFWEIKTFHLLNAKVVIDEVHIYEPYTLGLMVAAIKYLRECFNTSFFVMTATMPKNLKNLLQATLDIDEESVIEDEELLNKQRNIFETRDTTVDEIEPEINSWLSAGRKVLIVVNTVDEAIRLYYKYRTACPKDTKVICFHSRFIVKHRIQKEKEILTLEKSNQAMLLIATQVVEVSLDIDFDVLFTENAPIDALIQRAGRVNRKRKKEDTKVVVFKHQKITEEVIYNKEEFLNKTFDVLQQHQGQRLTEAQLIALVDEVYADYDVTQDEGYERGLNVYHDIQSHLHFIKDNEGNNETYTREGLDTKSVIPIHFKEYLSDKDEFEKSQHEVSISKKRYLSNKPEKGKGDDWFEYLDCDYDYETGLKFKKKDNTPQAITL